MICTVSSICGVELTFPTPQHTYAQIHTHILFNWFTHFALFTLSKRNRKKNIEASSQALLEVLCVRAREIARR